MPRTISWPTREEWAAKAAHSERTSCHAHERVSSDPADWLPSEQYDEARNIAAKVVRATRIALGKADRTADRADLNNANRAAHNDYSDVNDVTYGWSQIVRYARSVNVLAQDVDRLDALKNTMQTARDTAAKDAEDAAVARVVAERNSDAGWAKELQRRARIERGPMLTTITIEPDGSSTVSRPVPYTEPSAR